ncbi:unnamed protein product [Rangifer tarandus platyrhynchus]|uniref:Uncharacterized protein n=1 Tax=Rangifer tarandus platyrhynchus TaxID=3082113 RepID=A0AC59Y5E5_RANTA
MYIDECILKLLNLKITKISIFGIKSFIQNNNSKHTKQYCICGHTTDTCMCAQLLSHGQLCDPTDCSLPAHGLSMDSLLCSWDYLSRNTAVGSHFLLQGIFLTQGSLLHLLRWKVDAFTTEPPGHTQKTSTDRK